MPLAERTGLIQPFTEFVLTSAVAQLRQWQIEGLNVDMAINLSMRNLADLGLPQRIRRALHAEQIEPARVTLEVTESTIMSDPDKTLRIVQELAALGVRLSVDDFGTGYSSLSYLQRLPVRELKIDKSFVLPLAAEPGAMAIVRTIIDLARHLGLAVVAEGVEDNKTAQLLRELGCGYAQGYLLSRPMKGADFSRWVTRPATAHASRLRHLVRGRSGPCRSCRWRRDSPAPRPPGRAGSAGRSPGRTGHRRTRPGPRD